MNLLELSEFWCNGRMNSTYMRRKSYSPDFWNHHWQRERPRMEERNHWIISNLELESIGRTAADIGCGNGDIALELARQGLDVTALDSSEVAVSILETRAVEAGIRVQVFCQDWLTAQAEKFGAPWDLGLTAYTLGTVNPLPYLNKLLNSAEKVVIIEPAGYRHWQHPEFWPLLDGTPFDPGPDYDVIVDILKAMGMKPEVCLGEYTVYRDFTDNEEGINWLLAQTGVKDDSGSQAARVYLDDRLVRVDGGVRLKQTQHIAMLTINGKKYS